MKTTIAGQFILEPKSAAEIRDANELFETIERSGVRFLLERIDAWHDARKADIDSVPLVEAREGDMVELVVNGQRSNIVLHVKETNGTCVDATLLVGDVHVVKVLNAGQSEMRACRKCGQSFPSPGDLSPRTCDDCKRKALAE